MESEHLSGVAQCRTPLSGSRLCSDIGGALLLAVIALRQRRVDLVRAERVDTLVLEVDMCGCVERLFEGIGPDQRCGAIILVHIEHRLRDVYPCMLRIEFLFGALQTEDMRQVFGLERLFGGRIERRQRFVGHLSLNVVPLGGQVLLLKDKSFLLCHNTFIL